MNVYGSYSALSKMKLCYIIFQFFSKEHQEKWQEKLNYEGYGRHAYGLGIPRILRD